MVLRVSTWCLRPQRVDNVEPNLLDDFEHHLLDNVEYILLHDVENFWRCWAPHIFFATLSTTYVLDEVVDHLMLLSTSYSKLFDDVKRYSLNNVDHYLLDDNVEHHSLNTELDDVEHHPLDNIEHHYLANVKLH